MPEEQGDGRRRVVIERVQPQIDCGRFPIKRVIGETVVVEADVFADGHDQVACQLLYWREDDKVVQSSPMLAIGNDRWRGEFPVLTVGRYGYTVEGWIDRFKTWRGDLMKRIEAGQDVQLQLLIGARLIEDVASRASGEDAETLRRAMRRVRDKKDTEAKKDAALDIELLQIVERYPERHLLTRNETRLSVVADREKARFSAWYEVFPRSFSPEPGHHGTLRDCEDALPYIASMGFDVVYLPPIHPIGHKFRKGKNNSVSAEADDVGSPWAIGSEEGGHTSIHPQLGTLSDFKQFVSAAKGHGLEVALDIAFQCTPDHPYVKRASRVVSGTPGRNDSIRGKSPKTLSRHLPARFREQRLARSLGGAERRRSFLGEARRSNFSVDNPHTKPFSFWEWLIREIKDQDPEVLFLAEAFTRPHVMYRLAKLGFSQSYTYFAWRNSKQELTQYFNDLTNTDLREYFRPNLVAQYS